MKFPAYFVLFIFSSVVHAADWVKIGGSDTFVTYIDRSSIVKNGSLRKIWVILDFKEKQEDRFLSERSSEEFDCRQRLYRTRDIRSFSGQMGQGQTVTHTPLGDSDWGEIPPDSIVETAFKVACK
jgi:hypothetical protein